MTPFINTALAMGMTTVDTGGDQIYVGRNLTDGRVALVMHAAAEGSPTNAGDPALLCIYDEHYCESGISIPFERAIVAALYLQGIEATGTLTTVEHVKAWIRMLDNAGKLWHMDDSPHNIPSLANDDPSGLELLRRRAPAICEAAGVDIFDLYPQTIDPAETAADHARTFVADAGGGDFPYALAILRDKAAHYRTTVDAQQYGLYVNELRARGVAL